MELYKKNKEILLFLKTSSSYSSLTKKFTIYYIWKRLKYTLKDTQISLLHISVYGHHKGSCTEPG
jgi:hypothetical protein